MAVIVKPRVPETSDDLITDYLTDLLGDLPFEAFQTVPTGNLTLLGTKFHMRVGKFLGQPSQAIIAQQQFVKMRHVDKYDKRSLKVIDPKEPDACLYQSGGERQHGAGPTWCPPPYVDAEEQQRYIAILQQQRAAQQGLWNQGIGISKIAGGTQPLPNNPFGHYGQPIGATPSIGSQTPLRPQMWGAIEIENEPQNQGFWKKVFGGV